MLSPVFLETHKESPLLFYERMNKVALPLTPPGVLNATEGRLCQTTIPGETINYISFLKYPTAGNAVAVIVACTNKSAAVFLDSENPSLFGALQEDARFLQWKRAANETLFLHAQKVVLVDHDLTTISPNCAEMSDPLVQSLMAAAQVVLKNPRRQFEVLVFEEQYAKVREIPLLVPRAIARAVQTIKGKQDKLTP